MKYPQATMLITLILITLFGATLLYQSWIGPNGRTIGPLHSEENSTAHKADEELQPQAALARPKRQSPSIAELWRPAAEIPADEIPIIRKDINGAVLVELDGRTMSSLQVGDSVKLPVPQTNRSFTFFIQQVKTHKSGNKTLKGVLDPPPDLRQGQYSVVITLGQDTTFATLNTPLGQYSLVGTAKAAWIIDAKELNKHIDYEKPDFVANEPVRTEELREKPPSH